MEKTKFPKTPHVPWSKTITSDDIVLSDTEKPPVAHCGQVVVTEKLDGEGTSMYHDYIHARSTTASPHPSRTWVKSLHSQISYLIPEDRKICGENVYAKHSIFYDKLPTYFFVYAIITEAGQVLSWFNTEYWAEKLGLQTVPVLYCGPYDETMIKSCFTGRSRFGDTQEGYVIRNFYEFDVKDYGQNVHKFVRPNHVQSSENWMYQSVVPNKLINS